jgi:hypothetical protein
MKRYRKAAKKMFQRVDCPTQQAYTFTSLQGKRNVVQNDRPIKSTYNFQVLDGDKIIVVRTGRPVRRDTVDSMMAGGPCGSLRLFVWLVAISKLSFF